MLLNQSAPRIVRALLASLIRVTERSAHRFIDHYFFAERIYSSQYPHIRNHTILENKYAGPPPACPKPLTRQPVFVISGTITPVYGIEKAIHWFLSLHRHLPQARLHVVGHVPLRDFQIKIEQLVSPYPDITLNVSENPIDYRIILEAVQQADVVLMPYNMLDSLQHKIPSKLYESIALRKPVLLSENPEWEKIIEAYPAGLSIDFTNSEDAATGYLRLLSIPLYQIPPGDEVTWDGEKEKLLEIIGKMFP